MKRKHFKYGVFALKVHQYCDEVLMNNKGSVNIFQSDTFQHINEAIVQN